MFEVTYLSNQKYQQELDDCWNLFPCNLISSLMFWWIICRVYLFPWINAQDQMKRYLRISGVLFSPSSIREAGWLLRINKISWNLLHYLYLELRVFWYFSYDSTVFPKDGWRCTYLLVAFSSKRDLILMVSFLRAFKVENEFFFFMEIAIIIAFDL